MIECKPVNRVRKSASVFLKKVTAKVIHMMMVWCFLAEVKKMNLSALVICWEKSNDC